MPALPCQNSTPEPYSLRHPEIAFLKILQHFPSSNFQTSNLNHAISLNCTQILQANKIEIMAQRVEISDEIMTLHGLFSIVTTLMDRQSQYLKELPNMSIDELEFIVAEETMRHYDQPQDINKLAVNLKRAAVEFANAQNATASISEPSQSFTMFPKLAPEVRLNFRFMFAPD
jgi:hypothetical protein